MVDPFSIFEILKTIVELVNKFTERLRTIEDNQKDRDRLLKRIGRVSAIVEFLQQKLKGKTNIVESDGHQMMSDDLKGLEKTLKCGLEDIDACRQKKDLVGIYKASDIARKLREIGDDISNDMELVMFATIACNFSETDKMHADFKKLVNDVRAREAASISSELPILSKQIVKALPDLPPQVTESVQTYCNSIPYGYQNHDEREANKTMVHHSSEKASIKKNNVHVDCKVSRASLSDGSANKSASMKSVAGHGGPTSIVDKANKSSKLVGEVQSSETSSNKEISTVPDVYPPVICFPWDPNKKTMQAAVTLINRTDSYVAVWIDPPGNEQFTCPRSTMVEPSSTLALSVTMKMHEGPRPPRDNSKFEVLMIAVQTKEDVDKLQSASVRGKLTMDSGNKALVNKLHGKVFTKTLTVFTCEPTCCQTIPTIIETGIPLRSIDVHPTRTWIVTTSEVGRCVIWDYQKKKIVEELQLKDVCSAKFIVQKEWLAVGTGDGFIYVYSYKGTELRMVDYFKPDDGVDKKKKKGKAINSLAVHPRELYILLSSDSSSKFMQWQYLDDKWKRTRVIDVTTDGVHGLKYNPSDGDTFPSDGDTFVAVTDANTARIYTTESCSSQDILLEGSSSADYYPTESNQHLMITCQNASSNCKIWNLETGKVVHTLEVSGRKMNQVACHSKQPILATSTFIENKDKGVPL